MEKLAIEGGNGGAQARVLYSAVAPSTVNFIADDWMLEPFKVNSDLVRAPGLDLDIEQRQAVVAPPHVVERERVPPA